MNFKKLFTGVVILLLLFFARQQCLTASVSAQAVESQTMSATQDDSKPIEGIMLQSVETQGQINLSRGSKTNDINRVVTVQSRLAMVNDQNGNPYFDYKKLEPDQPYGTFGSATEAAVANFQKWFNKYPASQGAKSLRTDGVVDDATWAALGLKPQDFILARNSTGANVTQLQQEMERRKLLSMPTDNTGSKPYGYYGMSTQDAVNKYKNDKDIHLQNDGPYMGKVGGTTWDSLFKLLNGEGYLRQAVESRGGKVEWNPNTQIITARLNSREKQYDFVRCKFVNSSVVVKEQDLLSYFYVETENRKVIENNYNPVGFEMPLKTYMATVAVTNALVELKGHENDSDYEDSLAKLTNKCYYEQVGTILIERLMVDALLFGVDIKSGTQADTILEVEGGGKSRIVENRERGNKFETYVEGTKLRYCDYEVKERFVTKDEVSGREYEVVPDYSIYNVGTMERVAFADAKSKITQRPIELDAQAKGFIEVASRETTAKAVIYYKHSAVDVIPKKMLDYAEQYDVRIIQIEVK